MCFSSLFSVLSAFCAQHNNSAILYPPSSTQQSLLPSFVLLLIAFTLMSASNPGTIKTCLLVARRFLLGAPKLRLVGVYGVEGFDRSYELDAIQTPTADYGARRRLKRRIYPITSASTITRASVGSSLLIQQQQQQQQQGQLLQKQEYFVQPASTMIPGTDDEVEPYSLEPVNFDPIDGRPRVPVPYCYDSPHWRPDP